MSEASVHSVLDQLTMLGPRRVAFLSGAGISVEPPTGLPSGPALTRRVCEAFFPERTFDTLLDYHTAVGWTSTNVCAVQRDKAEDASAQGRLPRLETVLGVALRVLDRDGRRVLRILDDVRTAVPNRQHAALAAHLAAGGHQLTLNFDDCIEQRLAVLGADPDAEDRLVHLHGSFRADPEGRGLGLTLARIEPGFQEPIGRTLIATLATAAAIVVVGYSGSDFFDVDQTIAALPQGALDGTRLYWINHGSHPRWHVVDTADPALPRLVSGLARAGARPVVLCGRTTEFLSALIDAWGLDPGPQPSAAPADRPAPPPAVPVSESERREAALALYRELAIPRAVAEILDSGDLAGLPSDAVWLARSELLWEQGRWNDLLHQWLRRTPEGIDPLVRAERVGACLWVQGRLVPAYLWLAAHRRAAAVDPNSARLLAETEGRVVEHMARTPELRPIARCLAPRAVGRIRALGGLEQQAGVHAFRRRQDLTSSLDAIGGSRREPGHAAVSQHWFTEAGSLTAALGYRHRQLRDEFHTGRPDEELAADYRELADRFDIVGSAAGRLRTCLLPGAERVFGVREFVSALFDGQFGWWHRCRLLAHYLPSRVGHLTRGALADRLVGNDEP